MDPAKKNAEKYADILGGKIEKHKEEKQAKYKEAVLMRLGVENKHEFTVKWKEEIEDIVEIVAKHSNSGSETDEQNSSYHECNQFGFKKYDLDFRNYINNFNAVVVSKVKALIEKRFQEEFKLTAKLSELNVLHEIIRHYSRFEELLSKELIDFPEYTDRFKKLITLGSKSEHYPIFLYGSSNTGKTSLATKFCSIATNMMESKNYHLIVRYTDLSSQCSTFEGLLHSMCQHLNLLQNVNCSNELQNKDLTQLIDYFFKSCTNFSKSHEKHLILLIDGLLDLNVERIYLNKPSDANNQISWIFSQLLPAKVHMIVSIKRQASHLVRSETVDISFKNQVYQNNSLDLTNTNVALASTSTLSTIVGQSNTAVPLFLYSFNENMTNETENYLFEMPIPLRKLEINELVFYFKNELIKNGRIISDELSLAVIQNFQNSKNIETNSDMAQCENAQPNYLYLNCMMNEIINLNQTNISFGLCCENFPKDFDAYLKRKIGNFLIICQKNLNIFLSGENATYN